MALYSWEGQNYQGKKVKGRMEAQGVQQVYNALKAQKISADTRKIKAINKGLNKELKIPGLGEGKVSTRDIVIFTRQFATMINAGLPILSGLDLLAKGHSNKAMRNNLSKIRDHVAAGGTLAEGLALAPKSFDDLYVNMVAAGETGGILDVILERLAKYLEKMDSLRRQVKTAMIYPTVVLSAAGIVTAILLIFVIPTFADMFKDFGAELPAPTRIVMAISDFTIRFYPLIFSLFWGSIWLFKKTLKTKRGKEILHPIFLKLPVFGEIIKKVAISRFTRTLGTMISSGVPILEGLQICARTAGNTVLEKEILQVRQSISSGKTIAEPLENSKIFPSMVVQMIAVGESTGALDAMLSKVADFYEDEVENAVNAMKQLIEPIMILVLGLLIGGLVVAMYLPIFKLGSVI